MKDDKIYEMLNDAEIDLNEYEVEELSSEEKERYKTRIRMEVKRMNMETRNKKNKNIRKIAAGKKNYYLLESVEGGEKWGRYSFLGYDPVMRVSCREIQ